MKQVRKAIAWQYARSIIGIAAVYSLLALAKAGFDDDDEPFTIEDDMRSSSFAKVKIGKTNLDFMGGLIQAAVLLARIGSNETVTSKGKVKDLSLTGFTEDSLAGVLGRFVQSKLAPGISTAIAARGGKDVMGKPTTPAAEIAGALMPLPVGDIYSAMREHGVAKGLPLSVLALFGMGVQIQSKKLTPEQELTIALGIDSPRDFREKR